ncbi:polysaccharide deacetylase family protein [Halomonas sp. TP35]
MKSIMYHYIRPTDVLQPHLFYLHLDNFQRQLDFFEYEYGFIKQSHWQEALERPENALPEGVILTFDDGLIDHYRYVRPILLERDIWGIFYVSSASLQAQELLNVHRVHYLLGRFGGSRVLNALEKLLDDSLLIDGFFEQLKVSPYSMQSMDDHSLRVKKVVNYALKPECKDIVLKKLFQEFVGNESEIAQDFYMNAAQIREMVDEGFTFGAHGKSHNLLTKFSKGALTREVTGSVQSLNTVLEKPSNTFCYPYGGPDSWNEQVLSELQLQGITYGFCVDSSDITPIDIKQRPLCLPRYDCNEFPHGKAHIAK